MNFQEKEENPRYLTEQLITYIGNKRSLLGFIGQGLDFVKDNLNKNKLVTFDVFSGSGIVARYLKKYSSFIYTNDLEEYASIISDCYLTNKEDIDINKLLEYHKILIDYCNNEITNCVTEDGRLILSPGFISELYAPVDIDNIKKNERCFYTPYNACYIDIIRNAIDTFIPTEFQKFFIAPLLSQASIHANTSGVFKGFYKNSNTGIGKFGGNAANALSRITGNISLPFPLFSEFSANSKIFCSDANKLILGNDSPEVDLAYIDPPYNQHPYGSNYFMLNLIAKNQRPNNNISKVSGIPRTWNRSLYNKHPHAKETFIELVQNINAKYLLISFNNEGFISRQEMISILKSVGTLTILESPYNTFRASRNLSSRNIHVKEYLYIVKKDN